MAKTFNPKDIEAEGGVVLNLEGETPIAVRFEEDFGEPGLDIRQCYWPLGSTHPAYTKKGVRIPYDMVGAVLRAVLLMYGIGSKELEDLLFVAQQNTEPDTRLHQAATTLPLLFLG
jgi:hypothetical protein